MIFLAQLLHVLVLLVLQVLDLLSQLTDGLAQVPYLITMVVFELLVLVLNKLQLVLVLVSLCTHLKNADVAHLQLVFELSYVCEVVDLVDDCHEMKHLVHILLCVLPEGCDAAGSVVEQI